MLDQPFSRKTVRDILYHAFETSAYYACLRFRDKLAPEQPHEAANWNLFKFITRLEEAHLKAASLSESERRSKDDKVLTLLKLDAIWRKAQWGESVDAIADDGFAQAYLKAMCKNYSTDRLCNRYKEDRIQDEQKAQNSAAYGEGAHPRGGPEPYRIIAWQDLHTKLRERFPERHRDLDLIQDRLGDGMSIAEIQEKWGCSASEPYNAVKRVLKALLKIDPTLADRIRSKPRTNRVRNAKSAQTSTSATKAD